MFRLYCFTLLLPCLLLPAYAAGPDPTAPVAHRPRIGLALSGGGARGFAHIGVLKVLDELGIPVDLIAGTSMGSVVGALRALGYSTGELKDVATTVDWQEIFSDAVPRQALLFQQKKRASKFLMELGVRGLKLEIPSGLSAGQKISNLFSLLTIPAVGIDSFDKLPIPYRAVATDLVSGRQVVLDGSKLTLAQSMRASMAVPGAFTPLDFGDALLVDGGLVKNLPVDVVQDMGADIVIAVNVSAPLRRKSEIDSVLAVMDQTISLQMVRSTEQQIALAHASSGVVITPDLSDISSADFTRAGEIIRRGEKAARQSAELAALAEKLKQYPREPPAGSSASGRAKEVVIAQVQVEGAIARHERQLLDQLDVRAGQTLSVQDLESRMSRVFGTGYFESVDFGIKPGEGKGEILTIRGKEGGEGRLGFGLRYDDKYQGVGLADLTLLGLGEPDAALSAEVQFGGLFSAELSYVDYGIAGSALFVNPRLFHRDAFQYVFLERRRAGQYRDAATGIELALGSSFRNWGEVTLGYRWKHAIFTVDIGETVLPEAHDNVASLVLASRVDTLDRFPFPRSGGTLNLAYERAEQSFGGDVNFHKLSIRYEHFLTLADKHTLSLALILGSSLNSDLPGYEDYVLGGPESFVGYDWDELRGNHVAVLRAGYRYKLFSLPLGLGRDGYIRFAVNTGNAWDTVGDLRADQGLRYGGSVGLALDTFLGPVTIDYGRGDGGRSQVYFSAGYPF